MAKKLLSVAACFGATFELEKLEAIWNVLQKEEETNNINRNSTRARHKKKSVEEMISSILEEGLIERKGGWKSFRFIHDIVQEAAYSLIPGDAVSLFQVRIGKILLNHMTNQEELDSSLFLIMKLMNEAIPDSMTDIQQRVQMAELNWRAAQRAISMSALSCAALFTRHGIEFLPKNSWKTHYALTLELYSCAAEAAAFLGHEDDMMDYCDAILNRPYVPMTDKFRANMVLVKYSMKKHRNKEAIKMLLKILKKLGLKFAKREPAFTASIASHVLKTNTILKTCTLQSAHTTAPKLVNDIKQIQIIQYLDKLIVSTYCCNHPIYPVAIMKAAIVTDQHGVCDTSPVIFSNIGLLQISFGNFKRADSIAEYALALSSRLPPQKQLSRTKCNIGCFVYGWTRPYSFVMNLMLEAYQSGVSTGDMESALFAMTIYNLMQYVSGRRLNIILDDCKAYANQAREQKRDTVVDFLSIPGQMTLNLMGWSNNKNNNISRKNKNTNTTLLEGEMIPDADEFCNRSKDKKSTSCGIFWDCSQRLALVFGEFEKGADLFVEYCDYWPDKLAAHFLYQDFVFCGGMCCWEMLKQEKSKSKSKLSSSKKNNARKYKQYANKAYSLIKDWCSKGSPNVQHYKLFFAAQKAIVVGKKYDEAEKYFQEAISMSAKSGFIHDAAIGSELYGNFLFSTLDDRAEESKVQYERSLELYREWGAKRKVDWLNQQYQMIFENDTGDSTTLDLNEGPLAVLSSFI